MARIEAQIAERVADFGRGLESMYIIAIVDHAPFAARQLIQGQSYTNTYPFQCPAQGGLILSLHDEVDVIPLDRKMAHAHAQVLADPLERPFDYGEALAPPQADHVRTNPDGHMLRVTGVKFGTRHMGQFVGVSLTTSAFALAAPGPKLELPLSRMECHA